eukprot:CAMPEP_0170501364 /NCGR_PEP_ID=MMETSP0208-20121228/38029_1 /TAXON_ID=197538 /ORGANISM="Strombidium inclinatum, Strain S3" /LENGTH=49 /DNA_ID=CAMNT_0010779857 /DNA_START=122 /DNA_END=271 /DNA_ORIENTATION=-
MTKEKEETLKDLQELKQTLLNFSKVLGQVKEGKDIVYPECKSTFKNNDS